MAVLLSFRLNDNRMMDSDETNFYDIVESKLAYFNEEDLNKSDIRVGPPVNIRRGSYIAPNVVLISSYVDIGTYVDSGTIGYTWLTVGSCAQLGKNIYFFDDVDSGDVLGLLQAEPIIIEDNCFIDARSEVVEGVIVEEDAFISMNIYIGQNTKIFNRMIGEVTYDRIPADSVMASDKLPSKYSTYSLYCAVIVKQVDAKTCGNVGINKLLRGI